MAGFLTSARAIDSRHSQPCESERVLGAADARRQALRQCRIGHRHAHCGQGLDDLGIGRAGQAKRKLAATLP